MAVIQKVIPVLACKDIQAEHDFLVNVFGFDAGGVERDPTGEPVHGEVHGGGTTFWLHRITEAHGMVAVEKANTAASGFVVLVPDVDEHYGRVVEAGAATDGPPVDQFYGQREYGARDVEGFRWWFATPLTAKD